VTVAVRRHAAVALAVAIVALSAGACNRGGTESATPPAEDPSSTTSSTSSTTAPPTTTTLPPTTLPPTTTAAPPQGLAATDAKVVVSPTSVVLPVVGRDGNGVLVSTPCGKTASLAKGTPAKGVVVLDPGHGGVEPGAVGPAGLTEKVLNLNVASYTAKALNAAGYEVVQTRLGDYRVTLEARAKIVDAIKPKAFVSIHHNAEPDGPRPEGPGTETYYQTVGPTAGESKRLAGIVYEEVVRALSQYQGTAWVADRDAGAKYRKGSTGDDYYGILRRTHGTVAALAELGFITNAPEEALYARPEVQQVEGEAVARGIVRFLTTKDPGGGFVEPYPRETPAGGGGGTDNCVDPPLM
jgi:N-acetylmuramoyl-L-alanine amidase